MDAGYSIDSLTFDVPSATSITSTVLNTNGYTLILGANGLTLASTSTSSATINGTGFVVLLSSQNWANNSSSLALTVNTPITASSGSTTLTLNGTGTGGVVLSGTIGDGNGGGTLGLIFNQAGVTQLDGSNTYSGGTTLTSGTLLLNNGAAGVMTSSAIGTGPLAINGGTIDATVSGITLGTNNVQTWNGSFAYGGTNSLNLGIGAVSITGNGGTPFTETITANAVNAGTTLTIGGPISLAGSVAAADTLAVAAPATSRSAAQFPTAAARAHRSA